MNISLPSALHAFVAEQVESGRYVSEGEVVVEALALLEEQEKGRAALRKEFDDELGRRLAALDRGEFLSEEQVRDHFEKKRQELRQTRQADAA